MSRASILKSIKKHKPDLVPLPEIDVQLFSEEIDLLETFKKNVELVGGKIFKANSNSDVIAQVEVLFPNTIKKYSVLEDTERFNTVDIEKLQRPHDLEGLELLVLKGTLGVAENGAIWVADSQIPIRVLPFITEHLVLVVDKTKVVTDMHQAYEQLTYLDNDYGVFISGPSKTADIEQSLVIGAQGALSLSVFLKET